MSSAAAAASPRRLAASVVANSQQAVDVKMKRVSKKLVLKKSSVRELGKASGGGGSYVPTMQCTAPVSLQGSC